MLANRLLGDAWPRVPSNVDFGGRSASRGARVFEIIDSRIQSGPNLDPLARCCSILGPTHEISPSRGHMILAVRAISEDINHWSDPSVTHHLGLAGPHQRAARWTVSVLGHVIIGIATGRPRARLDVKLDTSEIGSLVDFVSNSGSGFGGHSVELSKTATEQWGVVENAVFSTPRQLTLRRPLLSFDRLC